MTVDSRYPDLDWFLQHWQRKLNRRFLAGEALVAWAVAAAVSVVPLWWVTAAGQGPGMVLWLAFTAAAALAFAAFRARQRLNRSRAASWLDQRYSTLGLFRAASECLDKENPGFVELRVMDDADGLRQDIQGQKAEKMPSRLLALRSGVAALVSLACLLFLGLVDPPRTWGGASVPEQARSGDLPGWQDPESDLPARELSPHEAARRLFPEDARMAALAEQALASGDPGALDALLEQSSDARTGARPQGSPPPQGGSSPKDQGKAGGQGSGGSSETEDGAGSGTSEGGQAGSSDDQGKPGQGREKPDSASPGQGDAQDGSGQDNLQRGLGGENPGQARDPGLAPGTGSSRQLLGKPEVRPPSKRQVPLKEQANPQLFEYVLPGAGSKLPAAGALADSRRSAEAVISRTSPPIEFENTIRDYFLSLSQEVSP